MKYFVMVFVFAILLPMSFVLAQEQNKVGIKAKDASFLDIREIAKNKVDQGHLEAIAIGVLDEKGISTFTYGTVSKAAGQKVNKQSLFNIGQIETTLNAKSNLADMLYALSVIIGIVPSPDILPPEVLNELNNRKIVAQRMLMEWHSELILTERCTFQSETTPDGSFYIGYIKAADVGVVVLSSGRESVDSIGRQILKQKLELKQPFYMPIINTDKKIGIEIGLGSKNNCCSFSTRFFYNYKWGPFEAFEVRPYVGLSDVEINDEFESNDRPQAYNLQLFEVGAFLELGNILKLLFPGTIIRYFSIQQSFKINSVYKMENEQGTDLTGNISKYSFQQGQRIGFEYGRFLIVYEFWNKLSHFGEGDRSNEFATDLKSQQQKIALGFYF